jgi:CheY-like chemotaxis protein
VGAAAFKPKIMVVEDDPAMLRLLGELLGEMGAEPKLLTSSLHAAELINRDKLDGAILDWRLPEMDGLELTRRIRRSKTNCEIAIVMLTGAPNAPSVETLFKSGVSFFLQKPVNVTQLRRLLTASRGAMLEERRRYQRAPLSLTARCSWEGTQVSGVTSSLSARGALLSLENPPPVGTPVQVELSLPTRAQSVKFAGVMVRVASEPVPGQTSGRVVAIEFTGSEPRDRQQVADLVEQTLESMAKQA